MGKVIRRTVAEILSLILYVFMSGIKQGKIAQTSGVIFHWSCCSESYQFVRTKEWSSGNNLCVCLTYKLSAHYFIGSSRFDVITILNYRISYVC